MAWASSLVGNGTLAAPSGDCCYTLLHGLPSGETAITFKSQVGAGVVKAKGVAMARGIGLVSLDCACHLPLEEEEEGKELE